jgi:predicted GNAT superfamily acetyltransferase
MPLEIKLVENITEMSSMSDFFQMIWADGPDVVSFDLGYAIIHVGGYASIAYENNKIVGASFGVRGVHNDEHILHSHVTATVVPGVGYELKKHQFNWAKSQGISAITWTFDPLVRRNCVFNMAKLGATAIEFLPNFYGTMTDIINAGDESDRLFAYWSTTGSDLAKSEWLANNTALSNHNGHPVRMEFDDSQPYAIYLPEDIENLRKSNLGLVKSWRHDVHELLAQAFANGAFIDQMVDDRKALLITPVTSQAKG